jgi:hypothetical protein
MASYKRKQRKTNKSREELKRKKRKSSPIKTKLLRPLRAFT